MRVRDFTFGTAACVSVLAAVAWSDAYVVVSGDCLSKIAHEKMAGPVYGKSGNLVKLINNNPQVKAPDLIFPGQELKLSDDPVATVSNDNRQPSSVEVAPISSADLTKNETDTSHVRSFELSPVVFLDAIQSSDKMNGGTANYSGGLDVGAKFQYAQSLSGSLQGRSDIHFQYEGFNSPDSRSLKGSSQIYSGFDLGVQENGKMLRYGISAGLEQLPFARAESPSVLEVDSILVGRALVDGTYAFAEGSTSSWALSAQGGVYLPRTTADYHLHLDLSYGYQAGISKIIRLHSDQDLEARFFIGENLLSTSIADQTEWQTGLNFTIRWRSK